MRSCIVIGALAICACGTREASPVPKEAAGGEGRDLDLPGIQLPEVVGPGSIPYLKAGSLLAASLTGITLDGTPVLALREGVVDPDDRDEFRIEIKKLTAALAPHAKKATPSTLVLALDHRLSYGLLASMVASAARAGHKPVALLARAGGKAVALPLLIPDRPPMAVMMPEKVIAPESDLTPEAVRAKIQNAYMPGIRRCYKDLLKTDPAAGGTLRLALTVDKQGRLQRSSARGVASACVQKLLGDWVFPIPRNPQREATEASFEMTFKLVADDGPPPKTQKEPGLSQADVEAYEALLAAPPPPESPPPRPLPPGRPPPVVRRFDDPNDLKLIVMLTRTEMMLWSVSGLEGTITAPRLVTPHADAGGIAKLSQALAEIVQRRWGGRARPEQSREIVLMAERDTTVQTLAKLIAAVRETSDGKELFRNVLLSAAFQ